ncbi:MAG: magnesium transporter CorA family protein [Candidatus Doudnabacteria bacterium]|nr:magnesium transporter CorA family protein [Candidatus Doudnabacteria bacterium]
MKLKVRIQTIHTKNLRWIDITDPGDEELSWLRNNFRFHDHHFTAVASRQFRPHIDQGPGYDFIVLLFPVYDKIRQEITSGEVDFLIGDNFLITVHYGQIHALKELFAQLKSGEQYRQAHLYQGSGFLLYKLLHNLLERSYPILDHMTADVENLEKNIFDNLEVSMLSQIALMKKNIIEFRKMMKTHSFILEKLPKRKADYLNFHGSREQYQNLLEYSRNIWDILDALKETTEGLADTNQALATHRLNQITKYISIFSAITLPATLVAFLFGIGVEGIPFRHNPYGFWIVAGIMSTLSVSILLIFKKKRWF